MSLQAEILFYVVFVFFIGMMFYLVWMARKTSRDNQEVEREEAKALKKKETLSHLLNNS